MQVEQPDTPWSKKATAAALAVVAVWIALSLYNEYAGLLAISAVADGIGLVGIARRKITLRGNRGRGPAKTYQGGPAIGFGLLWLALGIVLGAFALSRLHLLAPWPA